MFSEDLSKVPKLVDEMIEEKDEDEDGEKTKLSKRKLKKLNRLSVAELKQLVQRPDVVEMHDVTARDPRWGELIEHNIMSKKLLIFTKLA